MHGKILIEKKDLEIGMILGENVYSNRGLVLVKEGSFVDKYILGIIKTNLEYNKVYIKNDDNFRDDIRKLKLNKYGIDKEFERKGNTVVFDKIAGFLKHSFEELRVNKNSHEFMKKIRKSVLDIKKNMSDNMDFLIELVQSRSFDYHLYRHSINVAVLSHMIGQWMGFSEEDLNKLIMAGLLHDIGKSCISSKIINKPGKLNCEEFEEIKKHSMYSYDILIKMGYNDIDVLNAVSLHHEKMDGSGYPFGLKGDEIPIFARILMVADIFDAMTSNRVYKKKEFPFRVIEMFQLEVFGKLDKNVVNIFVSKFTKYYLGAEVLLKNGKVGKIIKFNDNDITSPLISVDNHLYIDVSDEPELGIVGFPGE
jgi:putative nucleotidyltransferase with HDIG domain